MLLYINSLTKELNPELTKTSSMDWQKLVKATTLHRRWSFPLSISSVNVTKSAVSCRFAHIYWKNPYWKTSFCVQYQRKTQGRNFHAHHSSAIFGYFEQTRNSIIMLLLLTLNMFSSLWKFEKKDVDMNVDTQKTSFCKLWICSKFLLT